MTKIVLFQILQMQNGKKSYMLKKHAPLKRFNKQELKFHKKLWITQGLQISIKKEILFFPHILNERRTVVKTILIWSINLNEIYSWLSSKVLNNNTSLIFFKSNNNIKKSWKSIKSVISMKSKSNNDSPTSIIHEGNFITDTLPIANVFYGFFSTVAQNVQSKIKFSVFWSDFLLSNVHESIIISQITEDEICKIISSLNSIKSTGPKSVPTSFNL